ncbi:MAG TPA: hypothetical protein VIH04_05905 [Nitrosarchaeum sp.]
MDCDKDDCIDSRHGGHFCHSEFQNLKSRFNIIIIINTSPIIQTIIEQLYRGIILSKRSIKHANHFAFISIDDAIMTCINSYIATNNTDSVSDDFNCLLELVKNDNKITESEKNDIKKFHRIRENVFDQPEIIIIEVVKRYIVLLKILLAYLYNFRASKMNWDSKANEYMDELNS